jgi:hypothetical protein
MNPDEHDSDNSNLPPHQPDGLELMCSGILATNFGQKKSFALRRAVAQLAAEEARKFNWLQKIYARWLARRPLPRIAFAGIFILAIVAALFVNFRKPAVGVVSGELNARWAAGSKQLQNGGAFRRGEFQLASGVVELTFNSKARVAVEGPAQFTLGDTNAIELRAGKLSADVPPPAHGFSVRMPNATVVDLGTRFGVSAANGMSRVDVFQGRVTLTPIAGANQLLTQNTAKIIDASGAVKPATFSEIFYPGVTTTRVVHPVNCGFDGPGNLRQGGFPADFGFWSGPACEFSAAQLGITPREGPGMLRFNSPGAGRNSEVWQIMDLRPYQAMIRRGGVNLKTFAWFNRVRGDANSANKFGLTIAAFHGQPQNAARLWSQRDTLALVVADKEFVSDDNPATWEKLEVSAALPPDADFLIVEIRAIAPENAAADSDPFPGHFADLIDCILTEPLQAGLTSN